jgi:threonine dehydrogenase-like Zn-dependent dehydrogenase
MPLKAGVYYGGKNLRVENVPDPIPGRGDVLIAVRACGICGSDLHEYRDEYPAMTSDTGRIMGHELVGVVAGLGESCGVKGLTTHTRVGVNPLIGCGQCERCLAGMSYICSNGETVGIHRAGGFAELITVPEMNCFVLPESVSDDAGALLDVYSCALHGLNRLPVNPGDCVVVIGTGSIAAAFAELSYLCGAKTVIMVGRRREAVERSASLVNAIPISSSEQDVVESVNELSGGRGADLVYECAGGTEQTLELCLELACQGGRIGVEGVHTRTQSINSTNALLRELTLTWFYSHGRQGERTEYETVLDLMAKQRVKPEKLISHHFNLDQISEAFSVADDHASSRSIKVVIHPTQ